MDKRETKESVLFPFSSYLTEKTGITFEKNRQEPLRNAISNRLLALKLTDPEEYFLLLKGACGDNLEFSILMDLLTIRESFFFRHKAQYEALRKHCLPRILERKGREGSINIWSAGCANGEEAYSIAMVVRDLIPETTGRKVLIRATDISGDALIQAKKGEYSERAIRELEPSRVDRFFLKKGSRYFLKNEIKSMVHFEYFNLAEKHFPLEAMPPWDLIFCRNVIIYFAEETTKRLLHNFYLSLTDGGYFFPGYSETLRYLNTDFLSLEKEGAFIYQKKLDERESGICVTRLKETEKEKRFTRQRRQASKSALKTASVKKEKKKGGSFPSNSLHVPGMHSAIPEKNDSDEKETGGGVMSQADTILAVALQNADQGKSMEAVALLGELIDSDPLCEKAYFLLAMICRNTGDPHQAIVYLKKAAYLNPTDPVVRLHLADAYKEASEDRNATREYANVITLLENTNEEQTAFFSEGFSKEALLETARAHLRTLKGQQPDTI